jgi:hypothetical protein
MSPKDIIFICYRFCDFALILRKLSYYYCLSDILILGLEPEGTNKLQELL